MSSQAEEYQNLPVPVALEPEVVDTVTVHAAPHPFKTAYMEAFVQAGLTLTEVLHEVQPDPTLREYARIFIDDRLVPRAEWDIYRVKPDDLVIIRVVPGGGKNPFRVLLQIAIIAIAFVVAPYLAPALIAGSLGIAAVNLATALVSTAIIAAGNALINVIAPIRPPSGHGEEKDSPNYFIDQARNQARPFQPVPSLLGTHRIVPPLGAQTYTEVVGDDQYLRMVVVWGYGPIEIENLRIGETSITEYGDVEIETLVGREDDPDLTLIPSDVNQQDLIISI